MESLRLKWQSEAIISRKTDNTIAKRKKGKQTSNGRHKTTQKTTDVERT